MNDYKAVHILPELLVKIAREQEGLGDDWENINLREEEVIVYFKKK